MEKIGGENERRDTYHKLSNVLVSKCYLYLSNASGLVQMCWGDSHELFNQTSPY